MCVCVLEHLSKQERDFGEQLLLIAVERISNDMRAISKDVLATALDDEDRAVWVFGETVCDDTTCRATADDNIVVCVLDTEEGIGGVVVTGCGDEDRISDEFARRRHGREKNPSVTSAS